ncbi:aspartate aminotransferase family protein [Thauera sp. 2A1]|uniref:aspartate aminotransferase family protein n=1 Tax=Thauera sp. 2A1 TaxID=2570191 RepID=UPI001290C0FB|nr:aspartate aminotransferase family protein [Thauera sp. 2A1]KAI5916030.1 aspartate aminotransferase family protein [Thauera sp. 2A1]
MSHVMNTYARLPVAFTHGEGVWMYDETGKRYLDALSGIAVNTLGHNHPRLVKAIAEQAGRLLHTSNLYRIPLQEQLSDRLAEISGMDEVFFGNSGAEANEGAIKLARMYGHTKGIELPHIIVMENAFHGRTLATLSATGNRKAQAGFEPLVPGFIRVPYKDIESISRIAAHDHTVVAVMLEVIQGEGGVNMVDDAYLRELRAICDQHGWLLICDEVQCGIGRTGVWFGWQHAGVKPDVMTLAKGLGSGVPIGAVLTAGRAKGLFNPGNHGSTFGGNPLVCAAALATLDAIVEDKLMDNAVKVGEAIRSGMAEALKGTAGIVDIRGRGLMIGIELDRPCGPLMARAAEQGLLISVTAERVVRLLPALVFSTADAQALVAALAALIRDFLANG